MKKWQKVLLGSAGLLVAGSLLGQTQARAQVQIARL
jgi:hypothetical protein